MTTSKETVNFGPFAKIFVQGVKQGDLIHLAGQVSLDNDGKPVGADSLVEQTRQTYKNVQNVLAQFGASMEDIVDETLFVTDVGALLENLEPFCEVRSAAYGVETPEVSQTCVQVAALVMPELQIEIKCTARC